MYIVYIIYNIYMFIYIYIYIYISKCLQTFNVLRKKYVEKKHNLFKSTNISLLFRSFINVKLWA